MHARVSLVVAVLVAAPGCFVDHGEATSTGTATKDGTTTPGTTEADSSGTTEASEASEASGTSETGGTGGTTTVAPTSEDGTSDPTAGVTDDPTTDASITDTSETTDTDPSGSTTSTDCYQTFVLPLAIEQAALDGWELTESMLDEGQVAVNLGAPTINDRVRWTFMLPCADTWFVWVRYYHFASGASYYAWLDETPEPPELAVFDGDCEDGITPFYAWEALRWRYEAADACETVAEPWVGEWDEGEHSVTLAKRDSPAIARALITNDPGFTPGPSD